MKKRYTVKPPSGVTGAGSEYGVIQEVIDEHNELFRLFDKLGKYEDMQECIEERIKNIKASSDYPHNLKGQMVDDLEWVLNLLN